MWEGVPTEFDVEDLNQILTIENMGHKIYTSRKALMFADFVHSCAVRNICRHRDLSDDILSPFSFSVATFIS